ncbi:MAG: SLC13 family permease [Phycisphaera sp.]|nr:SLC13 family permease [Phycisphaera sp.]
MSPEAWITLAVLLGVLAMLVASRTSPDIVMLGGLTALLVAPYKAADGAWQVGVLTPRDGLAGFANEGVITIAVLFVVAAGLRETGAMAWISSHVLGRPKNITTAQFRVMAPVALISAFLNNTPLVAIMLPVVDDWARKLRLSASKLLIPLSFASILGGACTLIGTASNLIVHGWLIDQRVALGLGENYTGLSMFELAWVGVPITVAGLAFILVAGRWLLPDRKPPLSSGDDPREYTTEMIVEAGSPLAGKTIEAAGLRHLPGLFIVEIDRGDQVLAAVSHNVVLRENDRLVFAGNVESVVDLQKIRGLIPATDQVFKLDEDRTNRCLVEAVVSNTCPILGRTIREGRFRTRYNAAVIAVARNGERIKGRKIGDIVLQAGDVLLLEARASFPEQHRDSRDFYLVAGIEGSRPLQHDKAPIALLILVALVTVVTTGVLTMLQAALLAAVATIATRCCRTAVARRAVDWQVLTVIAAALGLGKAMTTSGLAHVVADDLISLAGTNPTVVLAAVFVVTALLAAVITAKAAAVLMLPIAVAAAASLPAVDGHPVSFMPFVIAVMIAAATTVATPIGFPTNLMVLGPGGYKFGDYLRIGLPLTVVIAIVSVLVIPRVWAFADPARTSGQAAPAAQPAHVYNVNVEFRDEAGAVVATGAFDIPERLTVGQSIHGDWRGHVLSDAANLPTHRLGGGEYEGVIQDDGLGLNLNPGVADDNIFVSINWDAKSVWGHSTFAGGKIMGDAVVTSGMLLLIRADGTRREIDFSTTPRATP